MAAQRTRSASRSHPESFATWWSYHQAKRLWLHQHGDRLSTTLLLAVFAGALSGSAVVLATLVVVAVVGTGYVRSRT